MDIPINATESDMRTNAGLHIPHQQSDGSAGPPDGMAFYTYEQNHGPPHTQQLQQSQEPQQPAVLVGGGALSPAVVPSPGPFTSDETYACWTQDPMDLDYDPELASWVSSWDPAPPEITQQMAPHTAPLMQLATHPHQPPRQPQNHLHVQPQQQPPPDGPLPPQPQHHQRLSQQLLPPSEQLPMSQSLQQRHQPQPSYPVGQPSRPAFDITSVQVNLAGTDLGQMPRMLGPDDFLFPDDETAAVLSSQMHAQQQQQQQQQPSTAFAGHAPVSSPPPVQQASPARIDLNDPSTLELYDEMLIFSRGNHQSTDKLAFDGCDASKEAILHRLALKLKLSYSYDPVQRKASVWRPSAFSPLKQNPSSNIQLPVKKPSQISAKAAQTSSRSDLDGNVMALPASLPSFQPIAHTAASPLSHHYPTASETRTPQQQHTIAAPITFPLLQQDTNTVGLSVGLTPPPTRRLSSDSNTVASAVPSALVLSGQSLLADDGKNNQNTPSLGDRLSSSWNIFHSGISSRRPRGRRGPLSARSRKDIRDLEWAGGACWRCKILRRKCDPGVPCKNCPAPDLREDAPPWPLIGCRRGNLRDAMPPQVLCTKSRSLLASCSTRKLPAILAAESVVDNLTGGPPPAQPDAVSQCFREAEMQCLSDNKLVLDNPALFLRTHSNSIAAEHFSQSIRNGRYRANESLNIACQVHERPSTYSDLISSIAWELADNSECLNVLEIESVEGFMLLLETACLYEVEVGKSPMVALSLVCLRNCLDALRLNASHLLDARLHSTCQSDRCSINCLRELARCIDTYIEELSLLMFRKVNLRDRRWWLSTFYSLCIQAYVRRALLVIEQQLLYPDSDDADVLFSSQYLHLVTVLFIAVSFQYDPLVSTTGGLQLQQTLLAEEDGSTPDMFVPDRYFATGRTACAVDIWLAEGIKSSYQFLTRLLNIGSLDFDMGQTEGGASAGGDISMEGSDAVLPLRRLRGLKTDAFSAHSSPNSSTTSFASSLSAPRSTNGIISPPSSVGPLSSASSPRTSLLMNERRNSIGSLPSRLSAASFPSFTSVSASDPHSARLPPVGKPSGKAGSVMSESGCSSVGSTATATNVGAAGGSTGDASDAGNLVCTCCPKRPQRFDTFEELKMHQTKKPHICAFCGRRFSRMNEAERHITTIHLRPFSWSCRRLETPHKAYQCVSDGTATYDVCGFCGRQFQRLAAEDTDGSTHHDDQLTNHVEVDHKLHDCKASAKKFYREDMFGQHLKLSHAAEPGVWLKCLENACKADEKEAGTAAVAAAVTNSSQDAV